MTGDWDQALVRDIFWEEDVQDILAIPVHIGREDLLAWHFDKKGVFSVKSAYHTLHGQSIREAKKQKGESSRAQQENRLEWKQVWSLNCIPKIKHFVWRLAHNSLPVQMNIRRRGMDIDTRCPVCWRLDEDGGHYFLKCKYVVQCWREAMLEDIHSMLLQKHSAYEMVISVLSLSEETSLKVILLLYAWWEAQNKANAGEGRRQPS